MLEKKEQLKKDLLTYSEDLHSSYLFYTMTCDKLLAKIEKIEEECKNAPMCDSEFSLRIMEIIEE